MKKMISLMLVILILVSTVSPLNVFAAGNTQASAQQAYRDILTMYYNSISCNWSNCDSDGWDKVGDPDNACYIFSKYEKNRPLSEVGYVLPDINNDGQPELIVSILDIAEFGYIYDMYTIVNGEIVHVISSGERDMYSLAKDFSINNSGSSGAASSSDVNYRLDGEQGTLKVNHAVILDAWIDSENPYFYATTDYYNEETGETNYNALKPISEDEAMALLRNFPEDMPLNLTPFSQYDPSAKTADNENIIKVLLNGEEINFDQPPVMINDRVMVPIRAIFEAMGYGVDWNGDTQTAEAVKATDKITVQINNSIIKYTVDAKSGTYECDVVPQIISERTLVPVRAIAESAGCDVKWDGENKTVVITY